MAQYSLPSTKKQVRIQINEGLFISEKNHDDLIKFLTNRWDSSRNMRDVLIPRFKEIDKELAGHMVPNNDDKARIKKNRLGQGPLTVDENIQFALMQLDEAATFILGVFAPESGMYSAISDKENQPTANAFSSLMNKHARDFKHYRHLAKFIIDGLKFNFAGLITGWKEKKGPKLKAVSDTSPDTLMIEEDVTLTSGNEVEAVDMYNFLYDTNVNPLELADKGEFFATIDMVRPFHVDVQRAAGFYYGKSMKSEDYKPGRAKYYEERPQISHQYLAGGAPTEATNWGAILTYKSETEDKIAFDAYAVERQITYVWIIPKDFGLSTTKKYELWRFHTIQGECVVRGERLNNVHNLLPIDIAMPNEDGMKLQTRTFAEMLLPFQRFASAQMNLHQKAARKKLYGTTVINRRIIPALENEAFGGGIIFANPPGAEDIDLNKAVVHFNDAPDTGNTLQDISSTLELMQKILPTHQAQQVASLERATRYQAASLVQASNRRNLKLAKMFDVQALDPCRLKQMSNIFQYQKSITILDDKTGEKLPIDPAKFRSVELQFAISDGLRGLDKLLVTESFGEVIKMLLQTKAAQEFDIGAIIDYYLEVQGEKLDFTQFKYKSPMDALPLDVRNQMFQLFQQLVAKQQQGATGQPGAAAPGGMPGQPPQGQLPAPQGG